MYKQGNVWWCKISQPGRKPLYRSLGKDKKLAKAIEAKLRAEIHEGRYYEKRQGEYLTVAQLLDLYRERYAVANKGAVTLRTDVYYCRRLIPVFGDLLLKDVTPLVIEGYMAKRRTDGVSDITIHHELNLLRHAFSLACKQWDLIERNPFDKVKLPSGDRKRVRYLSPDEEAKLLTALRGDVRKPWMLSVVIVARETGLRLSNICNLTWKQVDLANRSIEIEKTKNGKPVWVPMSPAVHGELSRISRIRDLKSDRVFIVDGKPIHRDWVSLAFRRVCKRAGVENFRFHDLRHDFCSRLVQKGQPLHVVAELAGHEDISTTQRYAHLSPEMKRKAIEASFGYNLAIVQ